MSVSNIPNCDNRPAVLIIAKKLQVFAMNLTATFHTAGKQLRAHIEGELNFVDFLID